MGRATPAWGISPPGLPETGPPAKKKAPSRKRGGACSAGECRPVGRRREKGAEIARPPENVADYT